MVMEMCITLERQKKGLCRHGYLAVVSIARRCKASLEGMLQSLHPLLVMRRARGPVGCRFRQPLLQDHPCRAHLAVLLAVVVVQMMRQLGPVHQALHPIVRPCRCSLHLQPHHHRAQHHQRHRI